MSPRPRSPTLPPHSPELIAEPAVSPKRRREPFELSSSESCESSGMSLPSPSETETMSRRKIGNRQKHKCPVCHAMVIHLPHHLRQVHQKEPAKKVTSKQGYVYRICPVGSCGKTVASLKLHLRRQHGYRESSILEDTVAAAKTQIAQPVTILNTGRSFSISSSSSEDEIRYVNYSSVELTFFIIR